VSPFGFLAKVSGIALLMGALLGSYAWSSLDEPQRSRVVRQARWLVVPGYVGIGAWAVIFFLGLLFGGCDPLFGGWTRAPLLFGVPTSEVLSCSEPRLQARAKPGATHPDLPREWTYTYRHYDEASGYEPDTTMTWVSGEGTSLYHVPTSQLEFRPQPGRGSALRQFPPAHE
jgi:hypothetical protein